MSKSIITALTVALAGAGAAHAQTQSQAPAPAAPAPSPCASPEFRQLDFWVGDWIAESTQPDGTIVTGTNRITKDEYGACVISEHFELQGFVGGSYSIYDAQTKSWRQFWVDNAGGMFDLRGGPVSGQKHIFELVNIEPRGAKQVIQRMIWEDVKADSFTWRWQTQQADGRWVDSWVLNYKRKKA